MINKIGTPRAQDVVSTLGNNCIEAPHRLHKCRQIIIVYQLRISEYPRLLTKQVFDSLGMFFHLLNKFVSRVKETQTVVISLSQKLHTAGFRQSIKVLITSGE